MKRIKYESWFRPGGRPDERSRFILAHFDIPALNGTRHLQPQDRVVVATRLHEVFTRHPGRTQLHQGAVRGTRYFLSQSALANRERIAEKSIRFQLPVLELRTISDGRSSSW